MILKSLKEMLETGGTGDMTQKELNILELIVNGNYEDIEEDRNYLVGQLENRKEWNLQTAYDIASEGEWYYMGLDKKFKEHLTNEHFGAYNKEVDKYLSIKEYVELLERELKDDGLEYITLEEVYKSDHDFEMLRKNDEFDNISLDALDEEMRRILNTNTSIFDYDIEKVLDEKCFAYDNVNIEFEILSCDGEAYVKVTNIDRI